MGQRQAAPPTPSPELAGQEQQEWWPGHGRGRGGWNSGKGGGRWAGGGGGGRGRMWQGKSLVAKVRKDVKLPEGQPDLGFQWRHVGDGNAPRLTSVARSSFVGSVAKVGDCLLRVNGLDMAMMTEKQITDLLKQRPLELRFGDE
ncbi:dnc [Symbiodinium sp. CCMP2592]|nr:dnc [Symbiodinium sp. CCMP2592]